ncbi:DL-endopeptidase inhibitor IseA family protein [Bacillus sp. 31A1R]|uniref:DL-endopeptidase inhibitor IseA family protein n=1 Tax=Robertmurraya mangrovi TaxID=3098077 RepID=A0ABU5J3F4_9BACI|nr:DL-endopeptidase inhibitor IseA family protein [Bacillus sp. 31A1R]MDZ5473961.1 DL-endopeptidase inhibitor IseA family protein [Bacillus sp. 31A1R]
MKKKNKYLTAIILVSFLILSGCNFFPEPVTLIQAPKQAKASSDLEGDMVQKVKAFIPQGTYLSVPNEPVGTDLVIQADLDNDGLNELITFYKSALNADKLGAVVLQKEGAGWKEIQHIKGIGYEISWASASDITGDGVVELLLGWKVGVSAGNILDIYSWDDNELKKLSQVNYHELDLIESEEESAGSFRLAVWKRELAEVYLVDILRWNKGEFLSDTELYPSYFLKVANFYQDRVTSVPDAPYYWYYLADALLKANKPEEAIKAVEQGMTLDLLFPSRSEFQTLQATILNKIDELKDKDVQYYVQDADLTLNIPRNIYPYISIEGVEGQSNEYILSVYVNDQNKKGLLFAIEIYSKHFTPTLDDTTLSVIHETEQHLYGVRRASEHPFIENRSSKGYEVFNESLAVMEDIIESVRLGSSFTKFNSLEDQIVINRLMNAYEKYLHISMGGASNESGEIENFPYKDTDYRYLGEDINTLEKFTNYLSSDYTKDAIQSFMDSARIIEHNGRMAQPNADGGSMLARKNAKVIQVRDFGTEIQFDLRVPISDTFTYEVKQMVFKKTIDGWRIASAPSTF